MMLNMTEADYESWRDDLRCGGREEYDNQYTAASLYAGGWRADALPDLIEQFNLTGDEACATILVDDAQAWALQAAFSGKDHTKAGYFLRERGIGFCWSCEHLRGRGYVENSIKSVKVEEA